MEITSNTYQEIIDHLQSKKGRQISLLFGNGFSIAYDSKIFSYKALSNFIRNCKDETILKLFKIVDTTNFEQIMHNLDLFLKCANGRKDDMGLGWKGVTL